MSAFEEQSFQWDVSTIIFFQFCMQVMRKFTNHDFPTLPERSSGGGGGYISTSLPLWWWCNDGSESNWRLMVPHYRLLHEVYEATRLHRWSSQFPCLINVTKLETEKWGGLLVSPKERKQLSLLYMMKTYSSLLDTFPRLWWVFEGCKIILVYLYTLLEYRCHQHVYSCALRIWCNWNDTFIIDIIILPKRDMILFSKWEEDGRHI